jgi:hypothetical protein
MTLYDHLLTELRGLGPFQEEVKKTSIHLVRKSAFLGVHPRKNWLLVTIKSEQAIRSPRVVKAEQVSKSRWHCEVKLATADDVDAEFLGWARTAYELCS